MDLTRKLQNICETEMIGEINKSAHTFGNFNISLVVIDRSTIFKKL